MDPLQILRTIVSALQELEIPCMLVGSFASSSHGFPRLTQDADLIVGLHPNQVDGFIKAFSHDFYVDRGLIELALTNRTSFNIIHFQSSFKVDFFVLGIGSYPETEFSRRVLKQIDPATDFSAHVQTAEDTLLSKLQWYRQGGEVSENQWRDAIGILKVQEGRLDSAYLQKWANDLGISDLLERARRQATGKLSEEEK